MIFIWWHTLLLSSNDYIFRLKIYSFHGSMVHNARAGLFLPGQFLSIICCFLWSFKNQKQVFEIYLYAVLDPVWSYSVHIWTDDTFSARDVMVLSPCMISPQTYTAPNLVCHNLFASCPIILKFWSRFQNGWVSEMQVMYKHVFFIFCVLLKCTRHDTDLFCMYSTSGDPMIWWCFDFMLYSEHKDLIWPIYHRSLISEHRSYFIMQMNGWGWRLLKELH